MPDYQKRQLAGMVDVGSPGPLPADLQGLADEDLADLYWTYEPLGYRGYGFFPILEVVVPRIMDRTRWLLALQHLGGITIVFAAVDALGEDDPVYIYFHNTPFFDRDDERYDAVEDMLGATEANTDEVFEYANSLPRPAEI